MSQKEFLGAERLNSTTAGGERIFQHPDDPKGRFRSLRTLVYLVLMVIFVGLPWTTINGKQTLLIDFIDRHFVFFGWDFYGHDAPYVFFLFAIAAVLLVLITAVFGRAWCGWACPQTVFIDLIFRRMETWIEGNYIQRRRLDSAPMSASKFFKRVMKWSAFSIATLIIANSFLAYFVGSARMIQMVQASPLDNWDWFLFMFIFNLIILFDFGWFREQFCIIMCPYGRFQSVMLDSKSLVVAYDVQRGEPRGKKGKAEGACVDCNRCVNVCPTGIDIRDGLQMECIACTACIDACDDIMEKVKRPTGLIRYTTEAGDLSFWERFARGRPLAYMAVLSILVFGFVLTLGMRADLDVTVLRAKDSPYSLIEESGKRKVLNHFKLHLHNQSGFPVTYTAALARESHNSGVELIIPDGVKTIAAGEKLRLHFFTKTPVSLTSENGRYEASLEVTCAENVDCAQPRELKILGPVQND